MPISRCLEPWTIIHAPEKLLKMRIVWQCGLIAALVVSPVLADVDFMSVQTKLAKDYSGKGGDPGDKYFHEPIFHPHYDGRFASDGLPENEVLSHLTTLMQTYLATMGDIGAETWIMHGTLLGWWWNQKILPWDTDLDVQVSEATMHFLAEYHNMTEHHFKLPGVPEGRTYLLDINPHYVIRTTKDVLNVIDARWIDTSSGLFIDMTTVRADDEARSKGHLSALMCKDGHRYEEDDIFPLRDSFFEDTAVKIPYEYSKLLQAEYGSKSMTLEKLEGHTWNKESQLWVKNGTSKWDIKFLRNISRAPVRTTSIKHRMA